MPTTRVFRRMAFVLIVACLAKAAHAHELRPAYLQLTQESATSFRMLFKTPAIGDFRLSLTPELPEDCRAIGKREKHLSNSAYIERANITCSNALRSGTIEIDGLSRTMTDALVRIERIDGGVQVARLTSSRPYFEMAAAAGVIGLAGTYGALGIEHILSGIDHLLFVLALLLIVDGWRQLVATITAFTIAHSVTLAAAALGLMQVPQKPVEAIIALSVAFVASEIVHIRRGRKSVTQRRPWIVAMSFGLLHGLGFAGALNDIGLPQQSIPLALAFFNIGVEVGQLIFVTAVLLVVRILKQVRVTVPRRYEAFPAYGIGIVAAYWTIERTAGLWG